MERHEIKSRIEQLLTLYYLSMEVMEDSLGYNCNLLSELNTITGLCCASKALFNDYSFISNITDKHCLNYLWFIPGQSGTVPAQRRAIEVRIKFLEQQLNKYS